MREFFRRFFTDHRWFLGTIFALGVIFLFFSWVFNPVKFVERFNDFFETTLGILKGLGILAIIVLGIRMVLGHKPWWWKK